MLPIVIALLEQVLAHFRHMTRPERDGVIHRRGGQHSTTGTAVLPPLVQEYPAEIIAIHVHPEERYGIPGRLLCHTELEYLPFTIRVEAFFLKQCPAV